MKGVKEVVFLCLMEIGEERDNEELQSAELSTLVLGKNLDSLGIVFLAADLEERISDEFGVEVALADERAMSQKTSPFRSVKTLVKYVEMLVDEENGSE